MSQLRLELRHEVPDNEDQHEVFKLSWQRDEVAGDSFGLPDELKPVLLKLSMRLVEVATEHFGKYPDFRHVEHNYSCAVIASRISADGARIVNAFLTGYYLREVEKK